jgi:hypothetical protein
VTLALPPIFPEEVGPDERAAIQRRIRHSAWSAPGGWINGVPIGGARYRRAITATSPLLFALTYLDRRLRNEDTGQLSFCPFHVDSYVGAKAWIRREPQRDVRIAPRNTGKSILFFGALPLWALAHGHRRFFAAFSYTGDQAKTHLHDLLDILHGRAQASELLLTDFPELRPVRGAGGPRLTILEGGEDGRRGVAAYGLHESSHGLRMDEVRPDLLVGDDLEPGESKWSPKTKAKAISALTEGILPMNRRAVVQIVGTVTARGSMTHDAVRSARGELTSSWVQDARFNAHYYPAILNEGRPSESSLWPTQWPLEELLRDRYNPDGSLNRAFALGMMNDPVRETVGAYWDREFRYDRSGQVRRWVCWVDPAKSTHATSDHTAYVVAGLLTTQRPAVVVAAADAGHWSPMEMRTRILPALRARFEGLQVFVEQNALGSEENTRDQYGLKRGDQAPWAKSSKELRIRAAADVYSEGLVVHAHPLTKLEPALTDYGSADRDDLPDGLAGALGVLLPGKIPA